MCVSTVIYALAHMPLQQQVPRYRRLVGQCINYENAMSICHGYILSYHQCWCNLGCQNPPNLEEYCMPSPSQLDDFEAIGIWTLESNWEECHRYMPVWWLSELTVRYEQYVWICWNISQFSQIRLSRQNCTYYCNIILQQWVQLWVNLWDSLRAGLTVAVCRCNNKCPDFKDCRLSV